MKTRSQRENLKIVSYNLEKAIQNRSDTPHIFLSKRFLKIMESPEANPPSTALIKPSTAQTHNSFYSKSKRNLKSDLTKSPSQKRAYKIYSAPPFPLHVPRAPIYHSKKKLSSIHQEEIPRIEISPVKKYPKRPQSTQAKTSKQLHLRNKSLSSGFRSKGSIMKTSSCIELPYEM